VTTAPFRADRVYLGWQYALVHPDPGPPPRRPVPPEQEQLNQGWVAAQRREENLLSRPLRLAVGGCLALAALVVALAVAGILNAALTSLGLAVFLALAAVSGRGIWRGEQELRGTIEQEKRRVAKARAAAESRLFGWQDEHARMFRDWQARERAFGGQLQWYAVALPDEIDRVDVAGGTLSGWSAMLTMVAGPRLAAGGQVTVLDLSEGAVAQDLLAVARGSGIDPLVWVLPADLPGFDLGAGLPREALADVLAMTVATSGDRAGPPDTSHDYAILDRILEVIGGDASIAQVTAGLRALAQVGDPRADIGRGLITAAQLEQITALYGRGAADRVVTERAWALEAKLRQLEALGSAPVPLPQSRLRVVAMDRTGGVAGNTVLGTYVTVALTHVLRGAPPGQPWQHTLCLAGAEKLRGDVLDRLCDACEATRTGLVLAYRSLPGHVKERFGRGNAAVAFMRLGNAEDAKAASEQIGTEHRFLLTQLTDTVGTSVTDTAGDSYTSTVAAADSVSMSASTSETSGRSRGSGHSRAGFGPFGPDTRSGSRDSSRSWGTSDTESITEGITLSTAWGVNTSRAIGANSSLARTTQRSREFLVEQHELQQLPPSAVIVSYAARGGRRVVLADANPGLLALPTATLHSLEEVRDAAPMAPGPMLAGAGASPGAAWEPAAPGGAGGTGVPAGFGASGGRDGAGAENAASGPAGAGSGGGAGSGRAGGSGRGGGASGSGAGGGGAGGSGGAGGGGGAAAGGPGAASRPGPAAPRRGRPGGPRVPAGTGPVPPPTRDPAAAPISWRDAEEKPPPNLGPPPEPLDWRKRRK
jgi:hypothetical protein